MYSTVNTAVQMSNDLNSYAEGSPFTPELQHLKSLQQSAWKYYSALWWDLVCNSAALLIVIFRGPLSAQNFRLAEILKLRVSMANLLFASLCLVLWSVLFRITAKYEQQRATVLGALRLVLIQAGLATACAGAVLFTHRSTLANPIHLAMFFFLSTVFMLVSRFITRYFYSTVRSNARRERTVLIVGFGRRGRYLASQLPNHPQWKYSLFGFVDPQPAEHGGKIIGSLEDLEFILSRNAIDEVIIALPIKSMYDEIQTCIAICERIGIKCQYSADLFATSITKRRSFDMHDPSSVSLHVVHDTGQVVKRSIDIAFALAALALLSPLLLIIAIAVKLTSKGPIFFKQQRYGLNRRLFTMYKFRSMVEDAEFLQAKLEHMNETSGPNFKIKRDPRITRIGSFLRQTSLDELPQLWNVLIGNMSLVGPRPLPVRDVNRFSGAWLMRRFSVLPGITGLWQVSGRSNTTFGHWIKMDLDYIDRWSLLLDFKILVKTVSVVLRREGAA